MIKKKLKIPVKSVQKYEKQIKELNPNHEDNIESNNDKIFKITQDYHKNCFGTKSVLEVFQEAQLPEGLDSELQFDVECKGITAEHVAFFECPEIMENNLKVYCQTCFKKMNSCPDQLTENEASSGEQVTKLKDSYLKHLGHECKILFSNGICKNSVNLLFNKKEQLSKAIKQV